jgi:hypothetical protein
MIHTEYSNTYDTRAVAESINIGASVRNFL